MQNGAVSSTVAEFIDSDWGDKINSGIGLSYRPASHTWAGGAVRQPYAKVDFIPQSWIYEFGYRPVNPKFQIIRRHWAWVLILILYLQSEMSPY